MIAELMPELVELALVELVLVGFVLVSEPGVGSGPECSASLLQAATETKPSQVKNLRRPSDGSSRP